MLLGLTVACKLDGVVFGWVLLTVYSVLDCWV